MIVGQEFHSIIKGIFDDVTGIYTDSQLAVNCPRCADEYNGGNPDGKYNLAINTEKKVFHCWKCDDPKFSGSLGRLIKIYGTPQDVELYKSLGGNVYDFEYIKDEEDIPIVVELPAEMILFSEMNPLNKHHFEAYNYMINDRKISRDILLKYRIGFCIEGDYAKRIIIPSYDVNGDVNYFVARSYDPTVKSKYKYKNPEVDKNKIIFNEGLVNWDSTVYLVEGAFELLSFPVNIIPMLGKDIFNKLFFKLKEMKPNIVILLDPDAYNKSIEIFYKLNAIYVNCEEKIKIVVLPTEDDLDELRKNKGHDEVIKALYTARQLTVDDYFAKKLEHPYEKKGFRGYSSYTKHY